MSGRSLYVTMRNASAPYWNADTAPRLLERDERYRLSCHQRDARSREHAACYQDLSLSLPDAVHAMSSVALRGWQRTQHRAAYRPRHLENELTVNISVRYCIYQSFSKGGYMYNPNCCKGSLRHLSNIEAFTNLIWTISLSRSSRRSRPRCLRFWTAKPDRGQILSHFGINYDLGVLQMSQRRRFQPPFLRCRRQGLRYKPQPSCSSTAPVSYFELVRPNFIVPNDRAARMAFTATDLVYASGCNEKC